jgi:hypothetical protein
VRAGAGVALVAAALALACATRSDPWSYRLAGGGDHWTGGADDPLLLSLSERYPEFFQVILDPSQTREPDLRPLRDDLEREPVDPRNYDALNAVAMGYFELNWRAAQSPGGSTYFADSFRAAKLLSLPWRAYGLVDDGHLRDAILDFFEDAASGEKPGTAATAPRLAGIVASLEAKEQHAGRRVRIQALAEELRRKAERQRAETEAENGAP